MGFDKDGNITALRVHTDANLVVTCQPSLLVCLPIFTALLQGQYTTPAFREINGVFTHTTPVDAYPVQDVRKRHIC